MSTCDGIVHAEAELGTVVSSTQGQQVLLHTLTPCSRINWRGAQHKTLPSASICNYCLCLWHPNEQFGTPTNQEVPLSSWLRTACQGMCSCSRTPTVQLVARYVEGAEVAHQANGGVDRASETAGKRDAHGCALAISDHANQPESRQAQQGVR